MKDALIVAMSTLERVMPKLNKALAPGQWKIFKAWALEKLNNGEWEQPIANAAPVAPATTAAKTEVRAN